PRVAAFAAQHAVPDVPGFALGEHVRSQGMLRLTAGRTQEFGNQYLEHDEAPAVEAPPRSCLSNVCSRKTRRAQTDYKRVNTGPTTLSFLQASAHLGKHARGLRNPVPEHRQGRGPPPRPADGRVSVCPQTSEVFRNFGSLLRCKGKPPGQAVQV